MNDTCCDVLKCAGQFSLGIVPLGSIDAGNCHEEIKTFHHRYKHPCKLQELWSKMSAAKENNSPFQKR